MMYVDCLYFFIIEMRTITAQIHQQIGYQETSRLCPLIILLSSPHLVIFHKLYINIFTIFIMSVLNLLSVLRDCIALNIYYKFQVHIALRKMWFSSLIIIIMLKVITSNENILLFPYICVIIMITF